MLEKSKIEAIQRTSKRLQTHNVLYWLKITPRYAKECSCVTCSPFPPSHKSSHPQSIRHQEIATDTMGSDDEQEPTQTARSPRQTAWLGECAFSAIALAAHLTAVNDREAQGGPGASRHDKWTASVMIVNMSLAFLSTLAHHFSAASDRFVGKLSEGITAALVLALWCAGLPAVMDPDWDQAVDQNAEIQNANLYFSSWAALAVVIFVFGSYVTQHHLKGHDFSTEATPLSKSIVVRLPTQPLTCL